MILLRRDFICLFVEDEEESREASKWLNLSTTLVQAANQIMRYILNIFKDRIKLKVNLIRKWSRFKLKIQVILSGKKFKANAYFESIRVFKFRKRHSGHWQENLPLMFSMTFSMVDWKGYKLWNQTWVPLTNCDTLSKYSNWHSFSLSIKHEQ